MNNEQKIMTAKFAKKIKESGTVFIIGHKEPDFDSIGSALGIDEIAKAYGKTSYVIVDNPEIGLEPGVKKIKEEASLTHKIISPEDVVKYADNNSTLIITDVNKSYLVPVKDYFNLFKTIIIIDHHDEDKYSVETPYKYINTKTSSACEIVAQMLFYLKIKFDSNVANYLLAGIELDTKRYKDRTTYITHEVADKLMRNGATTKCIDELFLEDFSTDARISNLIYNGTLFTKIKDYNLVLAYNRENYKATYKKEDIAKGADKLLKYKIDASFVMGLVKDGSVAISARSKGNLNVGKILEQLHGGGNNVSAGARLQELDLLKVEKMVLEEIKKYLDNEEPPKVLKKD